MENPSSSTLRPNFGFAFNNTNFSDRVLHIEIMVDSLDCDSEECDSHHNNKHRRTNSDKEPECSTSVAQVKTLHISSPILAANSPFFYKLFENGTTESHQKDVTLKIYESEEASLMEVMNFMYNNTLSVTTTRNLLRVLSVAVKFQVASCVKYCVELLQKMSMSLESALLFLESKDEVAQPLISAAKEYLAECHDVPMSLESALLYVEIPSSDRAKRVVQPLIDASKKYLVERYENILESREEAMALPFSALEVILGSDSLKVVSEDALYDFIIEWLNARYPKQETRCDILTYLMAPLIRFPLMSSSKLKQVLMCPDFDQNTKFVNVLKALFFKVDGQRFVNTTDLNDGDSAFIGRRYTRQPIKVVEFNRLSRPRCVAYFELKKEDCAHLFIDRHKNILFSEKFMFGGRDFWLLTGCLREENSSVEHFALSVFMEKCSETYMLDCEIAVIMKPSEEFQSIEKIDNRAVCTPKDIEIAQVADLVIPWTEFMAEDSEYFIDGVLHVRVELTINHSQA